MSKTVDKYCLINKICSKELKEIYYGNIKNTNDSIIIKVISQQNINTIKHLKEKIFLEMEILQSLDCPYISKTINFLTTKNNLYLIFQYYKNGNLNNYFNNKKINETSLISNIWNIIIALVYLHKKKIFHCNITPSNILIDESKWILSDFMNIITENSPESYYFPKYSIKNEYVAPEILQGIGTYSSKSDIYSLGVIIYKLLYNDYPFEFDTLRRNSFNENNLKPKRNILKNPISSKLEKLLLIMLNPNQKLRYDSENVLNYINENFYSLKIDNTFLEFLKTNSNIINFKFHDSKKNFESIFNDQILRIKNLNLIGNEVIKYINYGKYHNSILLIIQKIIKLILIRIKSLFNYQNFNINEKFNNILINLELGVNLSIDNNIEIIKKDLEEEKDILLTELSKDIIQDFFYLKEKIIINHIISVLNDKKIDISNENEICDYAFTLLIFISYVTNNKYNDFIDSVDYFKHYGNMKYNKNKIIKLIDLV